MHSIARVVFASAALLSLTVAPGMAQRGGGGGFHGGMMGGGFHGGMMGGGFHGGMMAGGFHGGMMGPHGFHDGHFHDGHFHGHGFFPWWGFAPFAYGAYRYPYPYPYPAYPYPYYAGYASPGYY
jgi:hypothetical protein